MEISQKIRDLEEGGSSVRYPKGLRKAAEREENLKAAEERGLRLDCVFYILYDEVPMHVAEVKSSTGSGGAHRRRTVLQPAVSGMLELAEMKDAAEASNEPKASSPSSPRREATAPGVPPAPPESPSETNLDSTWNFFFGLRTPPTSNRTPASFSAPRPNPGWPARPPGRFLSHLLVAGAAGNTPGWAAVRAAKVASTALAGLVGQSEHAVNRATSRCSWDASNAAPFLSDKERHRARQPVKEGEVEGLPWWWEAFWTLPFTARGKQGEPLCLGDTMHIFRTNIEQIFGGEPSYDGAPLATGDLASAGLTDGTMYLGLQKYQENFGDVYKLCFGPKSFMVVSDPQIVKHILKEQVFNYDKGVLGEVLEDVMGKGLIPADFETWKVRRRAVVPEPQLFTGPFVTSSDALCSR
eukprot:g9973.t1